VQIPSFGLQQHSTLDDVFVSLLWNDLQEPNERPDFGPTWVNQCLHHGIATMAARPWIFSHARSGLAPCGLPIFAPRFFASASAAFVRSLIRRRSSPVRSRSSTRSPWACQRRQSGFRPEHACPSRGRVDFAGFHLNKSREQFPTTAIATVSFWREDLPEIAES
jgi:hypothetical protein